MKTDKINNYSDYFNNNQIDLNEFNITKKKQKEINLEKIRLQNELKKREMEEKELHDFLNRDIFLKMIKKFIELSNCFLQN